jgi:hypothetical protein
LRKRNRHHKGTRGKENEPSDSQAKAVWVSSPHVVPVTGTDQNKSLPVLNNETVASKGNSLYVSATDTARVKADQQIRAPLEASEAPWSDSQS